MFKPGSVKDISSVLDPDEGFVFESGPVGDVPPVLDPNEDILFEFGPNLWDVPSVPDPDWGIALISGVGWGIKFGPCAGRGVIVVVSASVVDVIFAVVPD